MLAEIDPRPDQITIVIGSTQMNILPLTTADDVKGTQLENPAVQQAYHNMVADATPQFYIEHLKRLRQHQIQPYFQLAHIHQLEEIEHLIRHGIYMGPLNHNLVAEVVPGAIRSTSWNTCAGPHTALFRRSSLCGERCRSLVRWALLSGSMSGSASRTTCGAERACT